HVAQMVERPPDLLTILELACQGQGLLQHGLGFSKLTLQNHRFAHGSDNVAYALLIAQLSNDRQRLLQPCAGRVGIAALPRELAEAKQYGGGVPAVAQFLEERKTLRQGRLGGTDLSLHAECSAHKHQRLSLCARIAQNIGPSQDTFERGPRFTEV